MIFTIGCIMMMLGFAIGHLFGDQMPRPYTRWNHYDRVGVGMFVIGFFSVLSSIFTITWRYMP